MMALQIRNRCNDGGQVVIIKMEVLQGLKGRSDDAVTRNLEAPAKSIPPPPLSGHDTTLLFTLFRRHTSPVMCRVGKVISIH